MTSDGLFRIANLFKQDISHVEFDLDGVTQTVNDLEFVFDGAKVTISFVIPDSTQGVIDNFKLIGTTITYDIKNFEITKNNLAESELISIPYKFVNVEEV